MTTNNEVVLSINSENKILLLQTQTSLKESKVMNFPEKKTLIAKIVNDQLIFNAEILSLPMFNAIFLIIKIVKFFFLDLPVSSGDMIPNICQ